MNATTTHTNANHITPTTLGYEGAVIVPEDPNLVAYRVRVAWEYTEQTLVMLGPIGAIRIDFTERVGRLRDEGFVITDVRPL